MKTIVTSIALISSISLFGQTQTAQVEYTQIIKMDKIEGPAGMDISDLLPESMSTNKTLIFDGHQSVYVDSENQEEEGDTELESDDGSFRIKFMREELTEIIYVNLAEKKKVHQHGFMGKSFVVSDELSIIKWKIGSEKISYLGYECTKATGENTEGDNIVAWFSPQIPVQCGPASYHGLPGLILMVSVNDGKREVKATAVQIENIKIENIKIPNDGKKVTAEEFKKIEEDKIKEMQEQHGENSFIFRN
ncbi:MAG: GLPGLI family protein [Flavobacteriales bacterium]|nr:GLPGLI family protein [Flavobacteriales bacterium]